jgi:hypothetical protein
VRSGQVLMDQVLNAWALETVMGDVDGQDRNAADTGAQYLD